MNSTPINLAQKNSPRSGEDQPRMLLFFFIAISLAAAVGVIVYIVLLASTNASKVVLNDEKDRGLYSSSVVQAHFSILSARYVDTENAACAIGTYFLRPATLTVRMKTILVPESCSIFINGRLLQTERRLEPDCGTSCSFSEFNRQFSLKENDYRDNQVVRVCCDDICIERQLEKLC